ncbi:hypothetical protein P691DRAFT_761736 [Macrolepiota fuliginosa MF-IS2]|uniref:Uncharacterized protein n=1 Tax=Macrolepiota fuliginosa MF-IS2 TaxID=1400762 RepID=A0A9P5XB13_9AGAR|nr:hypothetical protein P691DRAFT_761736 [Macrolepiota fuliginosa MF-IS2]
MQPHYPEELAASGLVFNHDGSSFGNTDGLYPEFYPLAGGEPVLRLVDTIIPLRCRPRELYLGARTARGQLRINVYFDANVYGTDLVRGWLDEVKEATKHNLLPTNPPLAS